MSALLNGKSVCQGYTDLFYTFMEKLDIPCAFVVSASANHTWNAVKLDGNWYHIDVTYDDPTYTGGNDEYTKVSHYWLLKSNNYFLTRLGENGASSHGNDFELLESDSTKYDSAFWNSVKSPIITLAGVMYYVDTATSLGSLYSYSTSTEKTDALYTFTDKWHIAASSTSFWKGVYSGLAYENGKLYFNTPSAIMSCELDGSNVTVEYQPELSADYSIYGCFEKNGKLYYGIGKKALASYIAPGSAVDFTDSFVNETKKDCIVTVIRKKNGRFDGCELVPVKGKTATVEVCGENDSASVIVIDENLSPVCEKIKEV